MDWTNPAQRAAFMDLHSENPREGPGDFSSTERAWHAALSALQQARESFARAGAADIPATDDVRILDLACGPGLQTQHLAQLAPNAQITALDITPAFVANLQRWVVEHNESQRIQPRVGDMRQVDTEQVDIIWCEGAVYMLGVQEALQLWRDLLRPGGCIAFTEPVFLSEELPDAVVENWAEYPVMTDVDGVLERVRAAGYQVVTSFVLGDAAWAAYYDPLQLRVNALRDKYSDDPDGSLVIAEGQQEIDAWRNHGEYFSYAFFVAQPSVPT